LRNWADILPDDVAKAQEEVSLRGRVMQAHKAGASYKKISKKLGVKQSVVSRMISAYYRDLEASSPIEKYLFSDMPLPGHELSRRLRDVQARKERADRAVREREEWERSNLEREVSRHQRYQAELHCQFEIVERFWTVSEWAERVAGLTPGIRWLRLERFRDHKRYQGGMR